MNRASQKDEMLVKMAGIGICCKSGAMRTLLGSCIGVALYERKLRVLGLAHIVMPDSNGRETTLGKYADTAIPETIRQMMQAVGGVKLSLTAKIAGGANMFANVIPNSVNTIGEQNILAVERSLALHSIPILGRHLGGTAGRRMIVEVETGSVEIHIVGKSVMVI